MGRPHRLPYHAYELTIERLKVCLIPQLCGEGIERLPSVVLPSVEASIYERLHPATQRVEQCCDGQSGGYDRQGGLLAAEGPEGGLQADHAPEGAGDQQRGGRRSD